MFANYPMRKHMRLFFDVLADDENARHARECEERELAERVLNRVLQSNATCNCNCGCDEPSNDNSSMCSYCDSLFCSGRK